MKKTVILTLGFLLVAGTSHATFSTGDSGTSTMQFLNLGVGARALAMGQAFTSLSNDATAINWNPAGLTQVNRMNLSAMHSAWLSDISNDWLLFTYPQDIGNFGVGLQYLSYGAISKIDDTGLATGEINPYDLAVMVSYSRKLEEVTPGLSGGLTAKLAVSKIENSASAIGFDIGFMYDGLVVNKGVLKLGLVARNLGSSMTFQDESNSMPAELKLGASYHLMSNWLVAADLGLVADSGFKAGVGTEYEYWVVKDMCVVGRLGYNSLNHDITGLKGITMGVGLMLHDDFGVDYAFVPYGDLGSTHSISLRLVLN